MFICGIISEYDPFHSGHAHQISAVRQALGEDCAVICVMSGNWTQRGAPAITDKHTRTHLALLGGADLVLELPLPYAISSAEWFARGGVSVLHAAGIVTHLCFGSECGDLLPLEQTAHCLDSDEYKQTLRSFLNQGISFPVARQSAVNQLIGDTGDCLSFPNNNLGVEYLRALTWCGSSITPITIQRQGAGHGESPREGFTSATHLRTLIRDQRWSDAAPYFVTCEEDLLHTSSISDVSLLERPILYRLRQMAEEDLARLPDCGEGLSHRLYKAIQNSSSVDEILSAAKSKRYTHARLCRILLWAFLGLKASDRSPSPSFLRVLGANETGRALLREMDIHSTLPILTKPAHIRHLSAEAKRMFELDVRASDLYSLCLPQIQPCGTEWTRSPIIL